jgi:hypothetical protein
MAAVCSKGCEVRVEAAEAAVVEVVVPLNNDGDDENSRLRGGDG